MSATIAPDLEPHPDAARTARFRVLLADPISDEGLTPLMADERFELVQREEGDLAPQLEEVDAIIVRSGTKLTRELIEAAPNLRVIGRAGVGVDNIDIDAATERGVAVLNAPSGNTTSAAELTFALLLSLARRIPSADRSMRAGTWDRKTFRGMELHGKTLGLVGAGRIGAEVARRARAFGMRIMAYDPYLSDERADTLGLVVAPLETVLEEADVLSLHVPLTEATENLIDDAALRRMKQGSFLINAARGGVVDEDALLAALQDGHLGGAALDVYAHEPLPGDSPLRGVEGVVLTPHLGAATREAQRNVAQEIAGAVRAALVNGDLSRAVNAPALSGDEMRRLQPTLRLAFALGRLASSMCSGRFRDIEVCVAGASERASRPVTARGVEGALSRIVGRGAINLVNAIHLAEARGIEVRRVTTSAPPDVSGQVQVRLGRATDCFGGSPHGLRVQGSILAGDHVRLSRIGDYRINVVAEGSLVVLRNRDVPGVIGQVGTVLGDAGANIAEYHQSRQGDGGEALAVISLEGPVSSDTMEALRALPDVLDARQAQLT
ncbi:MAG: phosphoglycerate dehydrogenase [Gemmatimonadota bacterium]